MKLTASILAREVTMQRRRLLQATATAAPLSLLAGIGVVPRVAFGDWPEQAFQSEELTEAERLLFGGGAVAESDQITIEAPDIAENGRIVPVEVRTGLPGAKSVTLFSDTNPAPLLARANFTPAVEPRISLRVKLGGTGNLIAIVEAEGGLYRAARAVKVTAGGCGG
jgi:sulfur-oxidizing protein SoxY